MYTLDAWRQRIRHRLDRYPGARQITVPIPYLRATVAATEELITAVGKYMEAVDGIDVYDRPEAWAKVDATAHAVESAIKVLTIKGGG